MGPVLIVDDNPYVVRVLERFMRLRECACESVGSVQDAIARLESGDSFGAIFCDLGLTDGSGADVVRWIDTNRPDLVKRIALITGGVAPPILRDDGSGIQVKVVQKPVAMKDFLAVLDDLLAS